MEDTKNYQKRFTRAEIQELLTQCRQSGKSKKEFALENGIKYNTLINWYSQERQKVQPNKTVQFSEIKLPESDSVFAELKTGNEITIRLYQPVSSDYLLSLLSK
jgi:transposase-like protein